MSQLGFCFEVEPQPQPTPQRKRSKPPRQLPPQEQQQDFLGRSMNAIAVYEPIEAAEAIERYRALIVEHHAAMLRADREKVEQLRKAADDLAIRMNGGTRLGIKGGADAPCYVLERATDAAGAVPLWGQTSEFVIDVDGMRVKVEMDGMFGIGGSSMFWLGFAAHAVDWNKPFLSETGYRSFLGLLAEPSAGMTPDTFTAAVIREYIRGKEMKGKLKRIDPEYARRAQDDHAEEG
jgi:hypothetical protein